jgi:hypothetical protein
MGATKIIGKLGLRLFFNKRPKGAKNLEMKNKD